MARHTLKWEGESHRRFPTHTRFVWSPLKTNQYRKKKSKRLKQCICYPDGVWRCSWDESKRRWEVGLTTRTLWDCGRLDLPQGLCETVGGWTYHKDSVRLWEVGLTTRTLWDCGRLDLPQGLCETVGGWTYHKDSVRLWEVGRTTRTLWDCGRLDLPQGLCETVGGWTYHKDSVRLWEVGLTTRTLWDCGRVDLPQGLCETVGGWTYHKDSVRLWEVGLTTRTLWDCGRLDLPQGLCETVGGWTYHKDSVRLWEVGLTARTLWDCGRLDLPQGLRKTVGGWTYHKDSVRLWEVGLTTRTLWDCGRLDLPQGLCETVGGWTYHKDSVRLWEVGLTTRTLWDCGRLDLPQGLCETVGVWTYHKDSVRLWEVGLTTRSLRGDHGELLFAAGCHPELTLVLVRHAVRPTNFDFHLGTNTQTLFKQTFFASQKSLLFHQTCSSWIQVHTNIKRLKLTPIPRVNGTAEYMIVHPWRICMQGRVPPSLGNPHFHLPRYSLGAFRLSIVKIGVISVTLTYSIIRAAQPAHNNCSGQVFWPILQVQLNLTDLNSICQFDLIFYAGLNFCVLRSAESNQSQARWPEAKLWLPVNYAPENTLQTENRKASRPSAAAKSLNYRD